MKIELEIQELLNKLADEDSGLTKEETQAIIAKEDKVGRLKKQMPIRQLITHLNGGDCPSDKCMKSGIDISDELGIFQCPHCKVGGDLFKFIDVYHNFNSFVDTFHWLEEHVNQTNKDDKK